MDGLRVMEQQVRDYAKILLVLCVCVCSKSPRFAATVVVVYQQQKYTTRLYLSSVGDGCHAD